MKAALIICVVFSFFFQEPRTSLMEKDKGLLQYKLGMSFDPKLGLKLVKKQGNTNEYVGKLHLNIDGVSLDEEVSSSFYKGKLFAFSIDIKNAAKTKLICNYLQKRYGNGLRGVYQESDVEIMSWNSGNVTIQTIVSLKKRRGYVSFIYNPLQQQRQKDPKTVFPELQVETNCLCSVSDSSTCYASSSSIWMLQRA